MPRGQHLSWLCQPCAEASQDHYKAAAPRACLQKQVRALEQLHISPFFAGSNKLSPNSEPNSPLFYQLEQHQAGEPF